jgi:hypothetical protein
MTRLLALATLLLVLMPVGGARAETRIALVIGNAAYSGSLSPLENPVNDAELIADALKSVGFDVISLHDASQKEMKRAIAEFGAAIAAGGKDVTGLFYYAGHGLQVGGTNYLVPVNAEIAREGDVDLESVAAGSILKQMELAGATTSIVILDACRNNPLARGFRSASRGLARMDAPNGSFLAYSTAPGDVAADGEGRNSPFARALASEMKKPDQAIEITFRNVRIQVMNETSQQQVPWDSSSMVMPFFFASPASVTTQQAAPEAVQTPEPAAIAVPDSATPSNAQPPEQDFVSPLPDGTIVLSRAVKADLVAYLAKVATMAPAPGSIKFAFFYVSEDGRHSGSYTCRADLLESGDCPKSDMISGSTGQSRERAKRACEMKAGTDCVYLYRADEKKAAYKTLE